MGIAGSVEYPFPPGKTASTEEIAKYLLMLYNALKSSSYGLEQDITAAQHGEFCYWVKDTNGVTYTTGNVGIGTASSATDDLTVSHLMTLTGVSAAPVFTIQNASNTNTLDPVIKWAVGATPAVKWTMGVDDSTTYDNLVVSYGTDLVQATRFAFTYADPQGDVGANFDIGSAVGGGLHMWDTALGHGMAMFWNAGTSKFYINYDNVMGIATDNIITLDPTNDRVGIYNTSPAYTLDVTGIVHATTSFNTSHVTVGEYNITLSSVDHGNIFIGDTSNSKQVIGLTINQQSNYDEIISLKNTGTQHGITTYTETDTYGSLGAITASTGGLRLRGFRETYTIACVIEGFSSGVDTTKSTAGQASILLDAHLRNTTTIQSPTANANLVGIRSGGLTPEMVWLVDEEGDTWQTGSVTATQGIFNIAVGTSPLTITSTTVCTNLNADLWDGYQFADYLNQAVKTTSIPSFKGIILSTLMPGWLPPKKITLPTPTANLTDFTVYVPISADHDLGGNCQSTGYDIRFTLSDGVTLLKYERVSFSVTDGKASGIFWVKVPAISTAGTYIYCWYGNASATDGSTPADSWDSYHKAVYHMQDYDTSHIHDSTVNANHGTKTAENEPVEADGKIGKGQSFDGTNDKIICGAGASLNFTDELSIELWVNATAQTSRINTFVAKGNAWNKATGYGLGLSPDSLKLYYAEKDAGVEGDDLSSGAWSHVAAVRKGSESKLWLYINGVLCTGFPKAVTNNDLTNASDFKIGADIYDYHWGKGIFDEIRISSTARSAAWIAYEFANQNPADGGLTWETPPADAIQIYSADYGAGDARMFMRGESGYPMSMGNQSLCGGDQVSGNLTIRSTSNATKGIVYSDSKIRSTGASLYRRYYHIPLTASNPGASGATWVAPGANTTGGWNLTSATNYLDGETDIHTSWDAASDLKFECRFSVNVDNSGGGAGDTVDLRLQVFYKGIGDTACKSQIVEVATVIGASARYKQFKVVFPIDYDYASNVVEVNDIMSFRLNLETDTSEVDDIVLSDMSVSYLTTHVGIEDGDE